MDVQGRRSGENRYNDGPLDDIALNFERCDKLPVTQKGFFVTVEILDPKLGEMRKLGELWEEAEDAFDFVGEEVKIASREIFVGRRTSDMLHRKQVSRSELEIYQILTIVMNKGCTGLI